MERKGRGLKKIMQTYDVVPNYAEGKRLIFI